MKTVIFNYANKDGFEKFVDSLLVHIGSDQTCADLFDVYVLPETGGVYDRALGGEFGEEFATTLDNMGWHAGREHIKQLLMTKVSVGEDISGFFTEWNYGYQNSTEFVIISKKSGVEVELGKLALRLFRHEAAITG